MEQQKNPNNPTENSCRIIGYLTEDVASRSTPTGKWVANFTLKSLSEGWGANEGKQFPEFTKCVAWGKLHDIVQHSRRGQLIEVRGRLQTRSWEGRDKVKRYTTEISTSYVQVLDGSETHEDAAQAVARAEQASRSAQSAPAFTEDDIPF